MTDETTIAKKRNPFSLTEVLRWIIYQDVTSNVNQQQPEEKKNENEDATNMIAALMAHNSTTKSVTLLGSIIGIFWTPYNEQQNTSDTKDDKKFQNFEKNFRSSIIKWLKYWMMHHWSDDFIYVKTLPNSEDNEFIKDRTMLLSRLNAFITQLKDENTMKLHNAPYFIEFGRDLEATHATLDKKYHALKHESKDRWIWDPKHLLWHQQRIIWIGFYKNTNTNTNSNTNTNTKSITKSIFKRSSNSKCYNYFPMLPKDIIKHILTFLTNKIYFESTTPFLIKMKTAIAKNTKMSNKLLNLLLEPDWNSIDISNFNIKDSSMDIVDIANQITLISFRMFSNISNKEYVGKRWTLPEKVDKNINAPNLIKFVKLYMDIHKFIVLKILAEKSLKDRVKCMKECFKLCEELEKLRNIQALVAVISAFEGGAIHRLKDAWKRVLSKKKYKQQMDGLKKLISTNRGYRELRMAMKYSPEDEHFRLIPHIGMFLKDLTFIEDGVLNISVRANYKAMNFGKWNRLYDRINDISLIVQSNIDKKAYIDIQPKYTIQKALLAEFELGESMSEQDIWNLSTEAKQNDSQ